MISTTERLTPSTLEEILRDVWSAYLFVLGEDAPAFDVVGPDLTGSVTVSGAWNGYVDLSFSPSAARLAAAAMLGCADGELADHEVHDAIGELANIVGGNVKSVLPPPTKLSIPEVTPGPRRAEDEGLSLVAEAALDGAVERIVACVWVAQWPDEGRWKR